ncbi:MAG: ABC transporter ATP-binding protein [Myxococcota bacterium]
MVVRARGLVKRYGGPVGPIAVDGIAFEVRRGECYGFLGPNGAGKTSTMKMIYGLSPVTEGELEVLGLDVRRDARAIKRRTGVVPQEDSLDPDLTVLENLLVYAGYFDVARREAERRADELLALVGLSEKRAVRVPLLSGGMKRRLVLARALVHRPELLLLDEPTTGLDPQARHVMWQALRALLAGGATIVLTTHYMEEAAQLCDRLCIMDVGRILVEGAPRELIARHVPPEVVEVRLAPSGGEAGGAPGAGERVRACLADHKVEQAGDTLFVYCERGAEVARLVELELGLPYLRRPANLEDVFLRLTGRDLRASQ